jgi:hypothetical protein
VQGGVPGTGNNFADNPLFRDADGPDGDPQSIQDNDYRLWVGSQCIDRGKNEDWMGSALDLDGNPRVLRGRKSETVDVGVFELVFNGPTLQGWYVDTTVTSSGDGTTWSGAFKTIQEAIDAASDAGDTVIVAEGTYIENLRMLGKNLTVRSTDPSDWGVVSRTILDGDQAGAVVTFAGTEDASCVLSGFTIRNGNKTRGGGICGGAAGYHTQATLMNNILTGNSATDGGGIAYCDGLIGQSQVYENSATGDGGGLFECDGVIQNSLIAGNSAGSYGGGLALCRSDLQLHPLGQPISQRGRQPTKCEQRVFVLLCAGGCAGHRRQQFCG